MISSPCTQGPSLLVGGTPRRARTFWSDAWRRLLRNKLAVAGLVVLALMALIAIAAPLVAPYPYDKTRIDATRLPPSAEHWLGTDALGRDNLSRVIYGARVSLVVGIVAQVIIISIGLPLVLLAGYLGGKWDTLVMRTVDVLYAFPDLLLIIIVMTYLRQNLGQAKSDLLAPIAGLDTLTGGLLGIFIAFALTHWLTVSRLVRGQVLSLKQREFIEAARTIGAGSGRILRVHLVPNVLAPVIVAATFGIPRAIITEAGLSFIGLGIQPPMPSWGSLISEGVLSIQSQPYMVIGPALALALTLLAFNFVGDGLRDALDPWMNK
ncbi:MAG: ABC transporter permease [Chloroflexi bacterium]|nr:ABC transporter permease [Chloroflexota bacterium]